MIRKQIPKFKSEEQEAQWWDDHREETSQWMEQAITSGNTTTLSDVLQRTRQRAESTPTDSIPIDPEDIARARSLAEKRGLRYQTYLKMLLHEALEREERRAG
jgi:predicted DNA binding CopG/RHH family protein